MNPSLFCLWEQLRRHGLVQPPVRKNVVVVPLPDVADQVGDALLGDLFDAPPVVCDGADAVSAYHLESVQRSHF